jgi:hypothetical protein
VGKLTKIWSADNIKNRRLTTPFYVPQKFAVNVKYQKPPISSVEMQPKKMAYVSIAARVPTNVNENGARERTVRRQPVPSP